MHGQLIQAQIFIALPLLKLELAKLNVGNEGLEPILAVSAVCIAKILLFNPFFVEA